MTRRTRSRAAPGQAAPDSVWGQDSAGKFQMSNAMPNDRRPGPKEAPIPKLQFGDAGAEIGIGGLGFIWSLVFGHWDLSNRES